MHPQLEILLELQDLKAQKRFEILTTKCNDDDTFAKVGVLCFVEGRDYLATGTGQLDAVTIRGHGYAFVHPDDSSLIGVVEYFERGLPGKLSADTKKLVSEFAKSVTMRK